jgi:hypothetical protein
MNIKFLEWIQLNKELFTQNNYTYKIIKSQNTIDDGTSIHLDSDKTLGLITLWRSGQIEYEFLECRSGTRLFWGYEENISEKELNQLINEIMIKVQEELSKIEDGNNSV